MFYGWILCVNHLILFIFAAELLLEDCGRFGEEAHHHLRATKN